MTPRYADPRVGFMAHAAKFYRVDATKLVDYLAHYKAKPGEPLGNVLRDIDTRDPIKVRAFIVDGRMMPDQAARLHPEAYKKALEGMSLFDINTLTVIATVISSTISALS